MTRAALLLLLPLAWLIACQDQPSPLAPEGASLARASMAQAPVKQLKGWSQGTEWPDGTCVGGFVLEIAGTGQATHLGEIALSLHVCLNPTTYSLVGQPAGGTVVADNGDTLYVDVQSMTIREGATDATYAITGGSGRFVGATGTIQSQGRPATLPSWANVFSGAIRY